MVALSNMAHHAQSLTPLVLDSLHERARKLDLLQHTDTARTFASINAERPRSIDRRLFTLLDERVNRFAQHLRDTNPFASAAAPLAADGIALGVEIETGLSLNITPSALSRHALITAPTGGAKTTYAHNVILQARARSVVVWVADPKLDGRYLVVRDTDFLIIERDTPFNVLQPLPFADRATHIHLIAHCFAKTHYGGEHTMQVMEIALARAYEQHPVPCLADVLAIVDTLAPKGSTYGWVDAVRNVQYKLWRLRDRYPVAFTTRSCNLDVLFRRSLYLPLLFQSTSDEFVFAVLAHLLFLHHYHAGIRDLTTLIIYDEGLTGWSSKPANIDQAPVLATLQVQLREMGIGMLVTSAAISMTSALLKSNVHIRVTMGAGNPQDIDELTRTFQFTPDQRDYLLTRITPGQAIVKIGTDVPRLVTFPNITDEKRVSLAAWQEALQRTDILRPPVSPLQLPAAREEHEGNGQPTPAQRPAPSSSPPSRVAPVVEKTPSNSRVPLNKHASALLEDVADHPLTLTTPAFARCKLRLSEGDRAKTQLIDLGFMDSHRVRTGSGRGKTGSALRLTQAGWQWLDRTPPKGTRGGDSAQHEFLVTELARRIPSSMIETLSVDLVIPYNTIRHAALHHALEALCARNIALNDGEIIALEIESSRPLTTGPRNVQRDTGFALTIIATLGKTQELQQVIRENDRVVIIDALRLLDALRSE